MTERRTRTVVSALCVVLVGASCGTPMASIDDLTAQGCKLLEVDGKPVVRAQSRYMAVVPLALVRPGLHKFCLLRETNMKDAPIETLFVSGSVRAGKRYEIEVHDRSPRLVEKDRD